MLPLLLFVAVNGKREPSEVDRGEELLPEPERGKESLERTFDITGCASRWLEDGVQPSSDM